MFLVTLRGTIIAIATVISADFRYLGQLKGGDKVHFVPISVEQAENSLFLEQQYYQMIIDFFNRDRNMS